MKTSWVQLSSRNGLESNMKIRRVHWVAKSWKNRNSISGKGLSGDGIMVGHEYVEMLDRTLDDGSVDELAVVTELAVDGTPRIFTHTGNLYVYECSVGQNT